jgi:hypothetical protein
MGEIYDRLASKARSLFLPAMRRETDSPHTIFGRNLSGNAMSFWNDMKIEFLTHHAQDGAAFLVIAKSKISHRKSKWMKFVNLLQGHRLQMVKVGRYMSPILEYKDTPLNDEINKNIFTADMNDASAEPPAKTKAPERIESPAKIQSPARIQSPAKIQSPARIQSPAKTAPPAKIQSPAKTVPPAKTALPAKMKAPAKAEEPDCEIARLFTGELTLARIIPSDSRRGALYKGIDKAFGPEWSRGHCVNLRVYWLLEVHRRVLRLEQALAAARADTTSLAPQRELAFTARKYVLIDPLTLGVPMLLGHLRGGFDLQADASHRLMAVTASIHPLLRYGMDLTAVAHERLRGASPPSVGECLFEWPFPFLPDWMRKTLAASPVPNAAANIERRVEKEQVLAPPSVSRRPLTQPVCAGRRRGAPAHRGSAAEEPAAQDVHPPHQARPRAPGRRHAPQAAHAAPAPDAEPAGRRVRPRGVPGPARMSLLAGSPEPPCTPSSPEPAGRPGRLARAPARHGIRSVSFHSPYTPHSARDSAHT